MRQRLIAGFALCLALCLGTLRGAHAAPITWEFQATVRQVLNATAQFQAQAGSLGVVPGAWAYGLIVYEGTTSESFPGSGTYAGAVIGFDLRIAGYQVELDLSQGFNGFYVRVRNPPDPLNPDLEFAQGIGTPSALFPTGPIMTLSLLEGATNTIATSALPQGPPVLADMRPFSLDDFLQLGFGTGIGLEAYEGDVILELVTLPEPEGLTLALVLALLVRRVAARETTTRSG